MLEKRVHWSFPVNKVPRCRYRRWPLWKSAYCRSEIARKEREINEYGNGEEVKMRHKDISGAGLLKILFFGYPLPFWDLLVTGCYRLTVQTLYNILTVAKPLRISSCKQMIQFDQSVADSRFMSHNFALNQPISTVLYSDRDRVLCFHVCALDCP